MCLICDFFIFDGRNIFLGLQGPTGTFVCACRNRTNTMFWFATIPSPRAPVDAFSAHKMFCQFSVNVMTFLSFASTCSGRKSISRFCSSKNDVLVFFGLSFG